MSEVSRTEFDQALAEADFAAARSIAAQADPRVRPELHERIEHSYAQAKQQAEHLAGRVQSLARADHYEGLLNLATDPMTVRLLSLLTPEIERGARVHIDGALRRQARFQQDAKRRMAAAVERLALLEAPQARQELAKVERRWLDEDQRRELDRLNGQVEEALAEHRELAGRTSEILRDHSPASPSPRPKVSRFRRGGCLGSVMGVLATVVITLVFVL